ncbi:hypothetical protein DSO57_1022828 [Entomophthora muscae]|uniref:Uncharacterized protein n=1 Tax=Entomophthora muscae TaxID=34485 RepID=A0ACC2RHL9_9FUNG|nr:hypothetical protein DSO57_1022828 [Entomophthora muscae]
MMAHLGLFAPVFERLAFVIIKVAIDSTAKTWPTLYMPIPSDSFSNLPLQIICLLIISISILCYTTQESKMLKLSSQFGRLPLHSNIHLMNQDLNQDLNHGASLKHMVFHNTN